MTERMRSGLPRAANQQALLRGRHRHIELWPFRNVTELVTAIQSQGAEGVRQRDALTRVLIDLHRVEKSPLWSEVLLVTYYPLLQRICSRVAPGRLTRDDVDQTVVMGFISALSTMNVVNYRNISFGIEQRTRRATFEMLAKEHRYETSVKITDDLDVESHEDNLDSLDLKLLMTRAKKDGVSKAALKVISITRDETLRSYCLRKKKPEKIYQRMKKQKTRALGVLRDMAADSED